MRVCDRCMAKKSALCRLIVQRSKDACTKQTQRNEASHPMDLCGQCITDLVERCAAMLDAFLKDGDDPAEASGKPVAAPSINDQPLPLPMRRKPV